MNTKHIIKRIDRQDNAQTQMQHTVLTIVLLLNTAWLILVPQRSVAQASQESRFHISMGYSRIHYHDMHETLTSSPLQILTGPDDGEWERDWEENRFTMTIGYDLIHSLRFRLTPHLEIGASQGRFLASNQTIGFSESWDTSIGPLIGGGLTTEVRTGSTGPFIELRYGFLIGWSRELHEYVTNLSSPSQTGAERTATFWHRSHQIRALAGWRERMWSIALGIQWTDFELRKTLSYTMTPRTGGATDILAATLLNAKDSVFHYHNRVPVRPCVRVIVSPFETFALHLQSVIAQDQEFSVLLEYRF
ncbi:hypothetical protein [Desulfovibrio inopinatus]|uniref:hypothetical protein n=1 Tax=Desulfovibrio inopinatus TaxID=102109 RepID=UPI000429C761|nr:hypothetical protein [Desulfovibrio inopinatus]